MLIPEIMTPAEFDKAKSKLSSFDIEILNFAQEIYGIRETSVFKPNYVSGKNLKLRCFVNSKNVDFAYGNIKNIDYDTIPNMGLLMKLNLPKSSSQLALECSRISGFDINQLCDKILTSNISVRDGLNITCDASKLTSSKSTLMGVFALTKLGCSAITVYVDPRFYLRLLPDGSGSVNIRISGFLPADSIKDLKKQLGTFITRHIKYPFANQLDFQETMVDLGMDDLV